MKSAIERLAKNLIEHSVSLQKGENLLIEIFDAGDDLAAEIIKEAQKVGGNVFLLQKTNKMIRNLLMNASEAQIKTMTEVEVNLMERMDAYIAIRGSANASDLSDVPSDKMAMYSKIYNNEVHMKVRIPKTKWCVMGYPTDAFAQKSNMSTEAFEQFYFDVCGMNYKKLGEAMDVLVDLLTKTDKVRITGKDTDVTFSIKGYNGIKCFGKRNIPDGEAYSAPVIDSAEGYITYNAPCDYLGFVYDNVRFKFEKGKIVEATGNNTEKINAILDSDPGARYLGEFALGVNPYITKPIAYTLFDEKMTGSLHLTPGNPYALANNGNKSTIHWDLVLIQTPEYGGGEIWFDDVLIRKDGIFVIDSLKGLNPENLIAE